MPTAELVLHQQSTVLPSLSILQLRFSNLPVTLQRISRSRESHQDISNLPLEVTRSSTLWSKQPLLEVVSSHTSTRLSSWRLPRPRNEHDPHNCEQELMKVRTLTVSAALYRKWFTRAIKKHLFKHKTLRKLRPFLSSYTFIFEHNRLNV